MLEETKIDQGKHPYFGRYQIIEKLGQGGMGIVYKAHDPELKRLVAIKTMIEANDAKQLAQFMRETQILAALDHPNIVKIFDIGCHNKTSYFTMEYIDGKGLDNKIKREGTTIEECLKIIERVSHAISYLHENKILHRDLKPANIMIDKKGNVKVMDFGVAKIVNSRQQLTQNGVLIGTAGYMAPEQGSNVTEITERSDVYSMGVIFYEMLTGELPFTGETIFNILLNQSRYTPRSPSSCKDGISKEIDIVCLKAIEAEPRDRYSSAMEFHDEIVRIQQGEPILARPLNFWQKACRKASKKKWTVGLAAATVVLLVALVVNMARTPKQNPASASPFAQELQKVEMGLNQVQSQEGKKLLEIYERMQALLQEAGSEGPERPKIQFLIEKARTKLVFHASSILKQTQEMLGKKEIAPTQAASQVQKLDSLISSMPLEIVDMRGVLLARAQMLETLQEYQRALEDYQKCLEMGKDHFVESRIGLCLAGLKKYGEAKKYLIVAFDNSSEFSNSHVLEIASALMGMSFAEKDWEGAREHYHKAYDKRKWRDQEFESLAKEMFLLAQELIVKKEYEKAEDWFGDEIRKWFSHDYVYFICVCRFYAQSFNKPRNERDSSLEKAFAAVYQHQHARYKSRAYLFLSYLALKKGDPEKANYYLAESGKHGFSLADHIKFPECRELLSDARFRNFIAN